MLQTGGHRVARRRTERRLTHAALPKAVASSDCALAIARHWGGNTVPSWLPFPRTLRRDTRMEYQSWMCLICGWIYDEEAGLPDEGIAPGTRWEDVPINWTCPECGARKEDFEMVQI
ncbi:Anaerobic nitric oxide reductase flavorubredoxin [Paraburkholderia rhynchosiae]|nr:Anaerobic nitric oxide reductase flavorubredoxin [Paraburkholderia rhynchosiae]